MSSIWRRFALFISIGVFPVWLFSAPGVGPAIGAETEPPPPQRYACRYNGKCYAEGQSLCAQTAQGPRLATCGRELNNASWKFGAPCSLPSPQEPPGAGLADPTCLKQRQPVE
jgi:hypothetical protein